MKIIFDTETTGLLLPSSAPLEKQPRIIEFGAILITPVGKVTEHSWLLNPGIPLEPIITKITGLTDADLVGKPSFADVASKIAALFAKATMGFAHNAAFDMGMIAHEVTRCHYGTFPWPATTVCTVQEYLHVFGWRMNLQKLYLHVMGVPLVQSHRALDDCRALLTILQKEGLLS